MFSVVTFTKITLFFTSVTV